MTEPATDPPACTFGEAVHLLYAMKQQQPLRCPPKGTKGERTRHTMFRKLQPRGLVEMTWLAGEPAFTVTEAGRAAAIAARDKQVAANEEYSRRSSAAYIEAAKADNEAAVREAVEAFRNLPWPQAYDALVEVVRLYVDPMNVRPEHAGVVQACAEQSE